MSRPLPGKLAAAGDAYGIPRPSLSSHCRSPSGKAGRAGLPARQRSRRRRCKLLQRGLSHLLRLLASSRSPQLDGSASYLRTGKEPILAAAPSQRAAGVFGKASGVCETMLSADMDPARDRRITGSAFDG